MFAASTTATAEVRPRGRRRGALALCALGLWGAATRADDAGQALRDMHEATRTLNYEGVFVYQRGDHLESMRLIHRYADGAEAERLISLSGPAREVIRQGDRVTCVYADSDGARGAGKTPPRDLIGIGFSAPVDKLDDNYRITVDGQDRVAGRPSTVVAVTPVSPDRYGYRLWLDEQSKLLLKSAILDGSGHALEQMQFTSLEVHASLAPDMLQPGLHGPSFDWHSDAETESDEAAAAAAGGGGGDWKVSWVPPGFEFKERSLQRMGAREAPIDHLVYSDGVAMVSIFVEAVADVTRALRGRSSRGAVNAFSRLADSHQITVVGEVPAATARKIARSVVRTEP